MARVIFTQQLERFTQAPEIECGAGTLRQALEVAFQANPQLRGYVLDEQGHLRKHLFVFIDGIRARDRSGLSDAVAAASEVYVMQALSGG